MCHAQRHAAGSPRSCLLHSLEVVFTSSPNRALLTCLLLEDTNFVGQLRHHSRTPSTSTIDSMARQRRKMLGATAAAIFMASGIHAASAQQCYYPNGKPSPNDSPCSSNGGACCPVDWQCLDNGLCFLEQFSYYERHSCTDKAWGSSCPDMCTYSEFAYLPFRAGI